MADRTDFGRSMETAGRLARPAVFAFAAALAMAATPAAAQDPLAPYPVVEQRTDGRPGWFAQDDPRAAAALIGLVESARLDGIDPLTFQRDALEAVVRRAAEGDPRDVELAERALDDTLVAYIMALKNGAGRGWTVIDRELAVSGARPDEILAAAARAPSLAQYVEQMQFLHPAYAPMRAALAEARSSGDGQREAVLSLNLERLRMLPASGRYVLVNAAAQTLQMMDGQTVDDEMKVVVGKADQPTPMMAALIRFTAANPYWNLPHDLVAERVAPYVLKEGTAYLDRMGYVILSDYGERAGVVDPGTIDWQAVGDGRVQLRMRQNPGPNNAMGRMKFMFPNEAGVYLHDTPNKELLGEAARMFSAGCVRLADAQRLATWLYGRPLETDGLTPEQRIDLDRPVPVYLGYFTAMPDPSTGTLATFDDIYGRDRAYLAGAAATGVAQTGL
jgi:murein L,D-transpeptidase YcbB/YkuD